jgi:hypothetical protein
MEIVFDVAKDAANLVKHGISLAEAHGLEWDTLWAKPDVRRDYGEVRMIGYAYIGARLFCVIFTDRGGDERRVISLRKASPREVTRYAKA